MAWSSSFPPQNKSSCGLLIPRCHYRRQGSVCHNCQLIKLCHLLGASHYLSPVRMGGGGSPVRVCAILMIRPSWQLIGSYFTIVPPLPPLLLLYSRRLISSPFSLKTICFSSHLPPPPLTFSLTGNKQWIMVATMSDTAGIWGQTAIFILYSFWEPPRACRVGQVSYKLWKSWDLLNELFKASSKEYNISAVTQLWAEEFSSVFLFLRVDKLYCMSRY